jgi:hypothetical protein
VLGVIEVLAAAQRIDGLVLAGPREVLHAAVLLVVGDEV